MNKETLMRAIMSPKAGPPEVLQLAEIPKPIPKTSEILVKVEFATVTSGDVKMRKFNRAFLAVVGTVFGFKVMKIPGVEFAGVVEDTGPGVTGFKKGDSVVGTTTGLSYGANAEYVCVPEHAKMCVIVHKPEGLDPKKAVASIVGGMTALQLLNKARVQAGDSVLVYGASGSVGSFGVQLAKHHGAQVTAVCSTANQDLAVSIGADNTIDYKTEDFRKNGHRYDVIFDAVGTLRKSDCVSSMTESGRWASVRALTSEKTAELEYIQQLVASGEIDPVIDREFSLDQVAEAHRYVETGRKKGNVVVRL